jgi:arylsulfatase A-like enzyme
MISLPEQVERRYAVRALVPLIAKQLYSLNAALLLISLHIAAAAAADRPNFLLIYTDDHGYGDVSAYGESDVRTPNIDRIAGEGMLFTAMRANATVCSPSRAALLTGRFADRVGVPGVIRTHPENSWGYFDPHVRTLADELKEAGYHTALIGKWHLGLEPPNTPNERGFIFFHGFLGDMMDSYVDHFRHGINYMRRNTDVIQPPGHATDLFSAWAVDHLRERAAHREQPFFLYLAYNAPHAPIEPPAASLEKVKRRAPHLDPKRARNVAFVEHLDDSIGRVLDVLLASGLAENTVVAFTSDNGGSLAHAQDNGPWRGGKESHYDGGLRVPFMIRWPRRVQRGSQCNYEGLTFDLFPTFIELAGEKPASDLDAVSLVPLFEGATISNPRDLYFVRREGGPAYGGKSYEALIRGPWKLLQNDPYSPLELYNLNDDPQEKNNLAAVNKRVGDELAGRLRGYIRRGGATPWQKEAN